MDPKIYPLDQHSLEKSLCDPDALKVVYALQKAGHIAYIVGGSVRDHLLRLPPKDHDISTSARPEEIKALFRSQCLLIGRRFRLAHVRVHRKIFEVSTFRAGNNELDELVMRDNEWGTPEQDACRRDFTINGLFYDPTTETIIDYVGGYVDLQKKFLRTIGQPYLRFKQDPVRMIRLLKFQARLHFEIDTDAKIALAECYHEIVKSSQARIFEDILRVLECGAAEPFIRLMNEHRFLEQLTPALAQFLTSTEGRDIFDFLREVDLRSTKAPPEKPLDRSLLLSCLVFPFLEKHLQVHFLQRNKIPHLGEIEQEVHDAISMIFHPFFLIPRKLRMKMSSILTTQFRMTPFQKHPMHKVRIPRYPEFSLALEFLHLRACIEPALKETLQIWEEAYQSPHRQPLRRRRRR